MHGDGVGLENVEKHHGSYATRGQSGEVYSSIEHALPPHSQLERQAMTSPPILQSLPAEPAIQPG